MIAVLTLYGAPGLSDVSADWYEADTQLFQQGQDFFFGLAPPQRIFALQLQCVSGTIGEELVALFALAKLTGYLELAVSDDPSRAISPRPCEWTSPTKPPASCDGHQFESPPLHQVVRAN
jgi:hypothetical protein